MIDFDHSVPAVVDVRGGAPGTRETDVLREGNLVQRIDALVLTGGSALGLAAADGVVDALREANRGVVTSGGAVPIVPAAVIFDLGIGRPEAPTAREGRAAWAHAVPIGNAETGAVGVGVGATVRKLWSDVSPIPGGLGIGAIRCGDTIVWAVAAVNAAGSPIHDTERSHDQRIALLERDVVLEERSATTLIAVIVDGRIDRRALVRAAVSAHDAIARCIVPSHTIYDGDVVFAVGIDEGECSNGRVLSLCVAAELAVESAIANALGPRSVMAGKNHDAR